MLLLTLVDSGEIQLNIAVGNCWGPILKKSVDVSSSHWLRLLLIALAALAANVEGARAQQNIGSTEQTRNMVSRELSGAAAPLNSGDPVFRDELVRTGEDSTAKLIFLDSTNLAIGPTSRVTLDRFVYADEVNGQKMAVNLAKGVFRFTTGALDKKAYTISTPTAAIGVRGVGSTRYVRFR
jgi:hypothetical protein